MSRSGMLSMTGRAAPLANGLGDPPALEVKPGRRDLRLDFWRGLCLIDMILVHLAYADVRFGNAVYQTLTTYTRFAAGGFVFLSGLCVGRIYLSKAKAAIEKGQSPIGVYRRVWARMVWILGAAYLTTLGLTLLQVLFFRTRLGNTDPAQLLLRILTFREGDDLLLMYVVMMAVTPAVLEFVRRGWWHWVALGSAAVFALGTRNPWFLMPIPKGHFPPLLWQGVFIGGILFNSALRWFDHLPFHRRFSVAGLVFMAFLVIFQSAHSAELGVEAWLPKLRFWKVPLTFGEALRYLTLTLSIVLGTALLWGRLQHTRFAAFACLMGRNSLLIYVAHWLLQEVTQYMAYRTWSMGRWQLLVYGVGSVLAMGAFAWAVERWEHLADRRKPAAAPAAPTPALVVAE